MKKLFIVGMLLLGSTQTFFSQVSFSHAVGISYYTSKNAAAPGITYSPRLNLVELGDDMTLSFGTHLGLGFSFNSQEGASSFALDLPLVAELNFGHASHKNSSAEHGGFVGAGFGISRLGAQTSFGSEFNRASGIVINAGYRTMRFKEQSFAVRASYLLNFNELGTNVFGIGLFYTFGNY